MKKIYLYGIGKGKQYVERCLIKEQIKICGYIDNYKVGEEGTKHIPIVKSDDLREDFDYIIITLMQYKQVRDKLISKGTNSAKIICFFSFDDADNERYWEVIDVFMWRSELMWRSYVNKALPIIRNYGYELYNDYRQKSYDIPRIIAAKEAVKCICDQHKSLARLGDNEFELILGRKRTNYHETDDSLGKKLVKVLNSNLDNLLIAIADNYGSLEKYTDEAADAIREYLGKDGVREEHMLLLDRNREYYDAYLSRPYYMYRDKENANQRFNDIKAIWKNQDVMMVEGEHTRFGVGNDLLDNARSIHRILTLDKNAYSVYDKLLETVKAYGNEKLILMTVGPVATLLAYDLAKAGYWAVDIGQLDVEYEWYLRGTKERCNIPYKTVSEVMQYDEIVTDETEEYIRKYQSEIVARII